MRRGAVRAGRDLPVSDPQPWIAAVELDVDAAGRESPVVEVAAVRVVERLGELADHLQAGVDGQVLAVVPAMKWSSRCQCLAVLEDDGGPGLVLVAVLLGPDDAVVRDALQGQVLAVGGALDGLPLLVGGVPLGEVDPDAARLVAGQRGLSAR